MTRVKKINAVFLPATCCIITFEVRGKIMACKISGFLNNIPGNQVLFFKYIEHID